MSSKNLFLAIIVVVLVAGAGLAAFWMYYLQRPSAPSLVVTVTGSETGKSAQSTTTQSLSGTTSATATQGTASAPKVTVEVTGVTIGPTKGNAATIVIFVTITNAPGSSVTVSSIKYDGWIAEVPVGSGGTDEVVSISSGISKEIRTELTTVPLSTLPNNVVNCLTSSTGGVLTLRIKGTLQITSDFGTASVPFEGEHQIGTPEVT